MIVCVCNNIDEHTIKTVVCSHSVKSLDDLKSIVVVCDQCECCQHDINDLISGEEENVCS